MEAKNLWGDLGLDELIRTPTDILKEQSSLLAALTNGILIGEIKINGQADRLFIEMFIVAPAVDNYRYNVLDIRHGIDLYPATVVQFDPQKNIECQNEDELTVALGNILGSERVRRVIRSLVAQSKAV